VRASRCIRCGACLAECPAEAIAWNGRGIITDHVKCTRCGACTTVCFSEARETIGREVTVAEVMAEIERDVSFYDESGGGVTFSGGEPLLQRDFLLALLKSCRDQEIHTAVDTAGFASWATLDRVRQVTDLFLYDLKLLDDALHRQFTGVSNRLILDNLRNLAELGHQIFLRVAIIPGINDDDDQLHRLGEFAASLPGVKQLSILPYHHTAIDKYQRLHKEYAIAAIRPPANERMIEIAQNLGRFGLQVKIGG